MKKLNLYIAAPLFSQAELEFNIKVKEILSPYFKVFLPQENAGLLIEMVKNGMTIPKAGKLVFNRDLKTIKKMNLILIILDGQTVDEGASFELGYGFAKNKKCFGLQTDPRKPFLTGNNAMIAYSCQKIFNSLNSLKKWAKNYNKKRGGPDSNRQPPA